VPLFERVLIANRGEIAHRIIRTCERLGIATVAVSTPEDRNSFHTRSADAVASIASYLSADEIVAAARATGATAIHPGYGFLAEQASFASAVEEAGLVFVGPPPAALRLSGDKLAARDLAARSGIPLLASGEPEEIGYPLLVKASAGGGGRGMRLVREADELSTAVEAAKREAASAFGDDRIYFERYLEGARHVEVQLLADSHGTILTIGERDCSIQRRHQKLIEESPSPSISAEQRDRLSILSTTLARAIGYENAGTAEFLVSGNGDIAFIELNARLQVEHPVTEAVWKLDLVEWQLRIAAGDHLDAQLQPLGHAVEARIYAEHPITFLPETGTVRSLTLPQGVRVDIGVAEGDEISMRYDPLIAKVISHAEDRNTAFAKLATALCETQVRGIVTNLPLLQWLVDHDVVRAGEAATDFFQLHPPLERQHTTEGPWAGYFRLGRDPAMPALRRQTSPTVDQHRPAASHSRGDSTATLVVAPMPGTVLEVLVTPGQEVAERESLLVLEAMKMETPVTAPFAGRVTSVGVAAGEQVTAGTILIELDI